MFQSIALPAIEIINIAASEYSPLISKCQIKVCYVSDDPNRNESIISKETGKKMAPSLRGAAIVGYYNEETKDFEGHNRVLEVSDGQICFKDTTRPYGFVDLNAQVWFQKFIEDGVEREYLMTEGYLWTKQYPECQRVIDKGNNQSMELDEDIIDAYWSKDENGNKKFFIINEAIVSKLCLLGEAVEPCFEGAEVTAPKIQFSFEDNFKEQLFSMMNEIKDILNKGGATVEDTKILEQQTDFAAKEDEDKKEVCEECGKPKSECVCDKKDNEDEKKKFTKEDEDVCDKCGKPTSECECDKKDDDEDKKTYNLEEIVEYVELNNKYSQLEAELETLKAEKEALESANNELTTFKAKVEKQEKEAMINSFYMLSDEDKKDCVDNIDTYSLSEIEAKLSVICVRNRVDFGAEDQDEKGSTTYTLSGNDHTQDANKPAWIKALDELPK